MKKVVKKWLRAGREIQKMPYSKQLGLLEKPELLIMTKVYLISVWLSNTMARRPEQ